MIFRSMAMRGGCSCIHIRSVTGWAIATPAQARIAIPAASLLQTVIALSRISLADDATTAERDTSWVLARCHRDQPGRQL
jgi:hypothetical protein